MKTNKLLKLVLTFVMLFSLTTPIQADNDGWTFNDGTWNYKSDGIALTGWHQIDNNWYAFDETGQMKTGWTASDEKWYFMGESGVMQSDAWVNDLEGSKYFIKGTGIMATDYVKDGYELDSSGKAVFMTQTTSVELTRQMDINNKVIEGNLYIDTTKFKELELNGITVTGKLVIMGEEIHDAKITIKDSIINTISSQTRGAEMTLAGTTSVTNIQIEENSAIKPAADYTGKVENIEVQSTAQKEVKIEVPAKTVSSNTFAAVTVNAKVDNLSVNKKTELTVNADIKNVTVNKTATDTKVEVSKGNTVGTIEAEAKVEVGGSGNVDKVTGAGKDESSVTPKPEKPSGGGGNSDPTPPIQVPDGLGVSTEAELINALKNTSIQEIYLKNDIEITEQVYIERPLVLNGNNKKLFSNYAVLIQRIDYLRQVLQVNVKNVTIKNLMIEITNHEIDFNQPKGHWNSIYGLKVYDTSKEPDISKVILEDVTSSKSDVGILINGSEVIIKGTTDISGNEYGGIEISRGLLVAENVVNLTLNEGAKIVNGNEFYTNPVLWTIAASEEVANKMISGFTNVLYKGPNIKDGVNIKNHYYSEEKFANAIVVNDLAELKSALTDSVKNTIVLSSNIEVEDDEVEIKGINKESMTLDLNKKSIIGNEAGNKGKSSTLYFSNNKNLTIQNGKISALEGILSTIYAKGIYSYPQIPYLMYINDMKLFNKTGNGNSIKVASYCTVNISNTTSESVMGGGMEAAGGTINVNENNAFTQTEYYDHNSTIGAASNGGTLNINEGEFTSENYGLYVFNSGGTINVHGGTFTAGKAVLKAGKSVGQYDPVSTINISGGTFDGKIEIDEGAILNITGGTFKKTGLGFEKFMTYVAAGYKAVENEGVFTVVADTNPVLNLEELTESEEVGNEIVVENQDTIGENIN